MRFNKNRKKLSLRRDNLTTYLDYNRERRINELLDARNECIEEIEILMQQMARRLKKSDLRLRAKRGTRINDIMPR